MKVYIVTQEGFPNGMAAASRIKCYAKAIINAGADVEVITYTRSEVFGKSPRNTNGNGIFQNIPFRYAGNTPLRSSNIFIRFFDDILDEYRTLLYLKKNMQSGDVILTYLREAKFDKKLFQFAKKYGYKIFRDLCEYPYAVNTITEETKKKANRYLKNRFSRYDGSICISESLLQLAKSYHPSGQHFKVPILIDDTKWRFDDVSPIQRPYSYIFHSGALLQQKDGILDVLKAFADAIPSLPKKIKYLFTGYLDCSPDADQIKRIIEEKHLEDYVEFLGYLSDMEMKQYLLGATLFIVLKNDNLQNQFCFATKLGEYLLSGNPVITTNVGEPKYYLKDRVNAILINDNRQELTNAIIDLVCNPDEAKRIGKEGKACAENNFFALSHGEYIVNQFNSMGK